MKHLVTIAGLLLAGSTMTVSCRKEAPVSPTAATQTTKPQETAPDIETLMETKMIAYTEPFCTIVGGRFCNIRGGIGCLLRFPPHEYAGFETIPVRFYEPVQTGQGTTGTQMVVALLGEGDLLEQVLGPVESDEAVIPVYSDLAHHLHCTAIEVINHPYTPVYNGQFPNGYIVLDCIAHH